MPEIGEIKEPHAFGRRSLLFLAASGMLATGLVMATGGSGEQQHPERQEVNGQVVIAPELLRYMPGATIEAGGVRIANTGFGLVEQDGSETHPNPPVAIAGAHLEVANSFAVGASIEDLGNSKASLQLYGNPPIIADEFRVERESVRLTVAGNTVTVRVWDGRSDNGPADTQVFPFTPARINNLAIVRGNGQLGIRMNGQDVGAVAERGVFNTGQLWFGADSTDGDWLLSKLVAAELPGGELRMVDTTHKEITGPREPGIQHYASKKRPGFTVGFAGALTPLVTDEAYANAMLNPENFGGMTTENGFKMQFTQPQEGMYALQEVDALVALARRNGQTVHGHTLVFAEANPRWFNDLPVQTPEEKAHIETIMLDRIKTLVSRYKGDIKSWDVINEPIADYEEFTQEAPLREHKWQRAMGEEYIVKALAAAYQANPEGRYFINEYGLEADGERWDSFIALLQRVLPKLQAQGVPASALGVGFQAHVYEQGDKIDPTLLRAHMQQLAGMGLVSQVSEMDVYSDDGDAVQAAQYADVFNACLQEPSCVAWRAWIASDKYNFWKDDGGSINQGRDGLYGEQVERRPAYDRLLQTVQQ